MTRYRPSDWTVDDAGWWLHDGELTAHVNRRGHGRWVWSVDGPGADEVACVGSAATAMGARSAACEALARLRAEGGG